MSEQEMFDAYADMMDAATEAGRSAYERGLTPNDCPYEDHRLQGAWRIGYRKAATEPTP